MSFLKITDPAKRDLIVQEFLKTRKNIQHSNLSERLGDIDVQRDMTKFFKPLTTVQEKTAQEAANMSSNILAELKPLRKSIQDIPKALTFPQEIKEDITQPSFIGPIAEQYLRKYASKDDVDKTYGLYDKQGFFYIGDKQVNIIDDNIIVGDDEYKGTPGLWELLVSKTPNSEIYTDEDYEKYAEIMLKTNSLRKGNNSKEPKPKASRGWKWKHIMSPIWNNKNDFEGSGVRVAPAGPTDPNVLLERFDLLMASKTAGNTGVKGEILTICKKLKTMGIFNKEEFKNILSQL